MPAKRLSKSQFMMGKQCLKRLWLYNYRRDLIPPVDPARQHIFDEGHAIGELARGYFPGGELADADFMHIPEALAQTAALIEGGSRVIYEGALVYNNVLVRCDILKKNRDGSWDLIEVKSSTEVKEDHLQDVAVQSYVAEGAGLKIRKAELMRVDNTFVKSGPIDPEKFFVREDITAAAAAKMPEITRDLRSFMAALSSRDVPGIDIGRHCSAPYECEFRAHCWKDVPANSIYDIPRLSWEKKNALRAMGIMRYKDVPDSFELNEGQRLCVRAEKTGETVLDRTAIAGFLKKLKYPLYHIDFETIMPALPLYDGTRPYQQVPFQLSVHVQAEPGAEPRHFEYLGDGRKDPRPGLIGFMLEKIGPEGSLLAYNAAFEAKRIEELARDFPARSGALSALIGRMRDLMKPFRELAYVHPLFHGRYSIKKVLPALIPDMTYEGLPIANGGDAQLAYYNMLSGGLTPAETEKLRRDLKVYCGQDTLAMVKILEHLRQVCGI